MSRTRKSGSVRDPRRIAAQSFTGSVNVSRDGWRAVSVESLLEQDWVVQTDAFGFDLRSIVSQPMKMPYRFDGRQRHWIPDFLRTRKGPPGRGDLRPTLVEVKPLISVYQPEGPDQEEDAEWVLGKFEAIRLTAMGWGYDFELATENEIRHEPRLTNAGLMRRSAERDYVPGWEDLGRAAVLMLPHASSIEDLAQLLPADVDAFSVALRLAWTGEITIDPRWRWSRSSSFVRSGRPKA